MRISIIGQPASGKTALAQKISAKLHIPHIHIDRLYFESGGHNLSSGESEAKDKMRAYIRDAVTNLIAQESWVSDGWYRRVQSLIAERADVILFLDIPLYRRLLSHLYRAFFTTRHQEVTVWRDIRFMYTMVARMFTHEPRIRAFVHEHASKVKTLRSYREINAYLANVH